MADDPQILAPGLRFGRDTSLKARVLGWLQRRRPAPQPSALWNLQYRDGRWLLLLSSYGPGEMTLPPGFTTREIGPDDADQALAWSYSILPDGIEHTINRI